MNRFTPEELDSLADLVAAKVLAKIPAHVCAFSAEDQVFLKGAARNARSVTNVATGTVVTAAVLALLGFLGHAVIQYVQKLAAQPAVSP